MSGVSIETTQNVSLDYPVASVGDRILEAVIDVVILFAYLISISFVLTSASLIGTSDTQDVVILIIVLIPFFFYSLLCEYFMGGQSFGKKVVRTKVIKLDGSQPTIGDYLLRWLFRLVDVWFFWGLIGVITILASKKGQRVGDILAGTTVVKIGRRISLADTILTEAETDYTPHFIQASNLTDEQAGLIKEVLNAYYRDDNYHAVDVLVSKLKSLLNIETKMPPLEFLNTLLKDYAHLTDNLYLLSR